MTIRMQKVVFATFTLAILSLVVMVAAVPVISKINADYRRIDPWAGEIPNPWERRVQDGELAELAELDVPEWYRSHDKVTPEEEEALEEYCEAYPEIEVGERPIPCTVNGVKGIVYEKAGQIYMNLGPITKRIVG